MAVGDVFKLVVTMTQANSYMQNTYAFKVLQAGDVSVAQSILLANDFKEAFRPQQVSGVVYRSWKLYQVFGGGVDYTQTPCKREGGRVLEQAYGGTVAGGDASQALPPQCAWVITLYSDQIGRRHRGRIYVPGFSENKQSDGNWGAAELTTMNTALATLVNKYGPSGTATDFQWGIWSERTAFGCVTRDVPPYDHYQADTPAPQLAFTPLDRVLARGIVYTQRRRVIGVGR
jgi:hypothetical protein